jgi:hypothetical protein
LIGKPNPDKPELNIENGRLKICGIASLYLFEKVMSAED